MTFFRMFFGFLLQVMPFAFICFYPFKERLRFSARKICILSVITLSLLASIFSGIACFLKTILPPEQILFISVNIVFLFCLILCAFLYLYLIKEIWQKKLFIFSFMMTAALAMTSVNTIIETWLQQADSDGLPYGGSTLLTLSAQTFIVIPFLWLLLKRYYLPIADGLDKRESGYLSLLSIFLFIVLGSALIPIDYMNIYNPLSLLLYFALMFAVFVIYFVCFRLLFLSRQNIREMQALDQTRHQLEIQTEQYKRILEITESSRKMHHDLRHHALIIQGFLNSGETIQAEDYLQKYIQTLDKYEVTKFCKNTVINILISHYQALAMDKKIIFTVRINLPSKLTVSDFDISVLLGNLLENAIEAASHASEAERLILLNIISSGKMLAITVDNGFDGHVNLDGDKYLSTKKRHTGIGLKSITNIAEKYNGGVQFSHEETIFHASVMLGT